MGASCFFIPSVNLIGTGSLEAAVGNIRSYGSSAR